MVDILFLSKNRKEFTEASLAALIQNTNWALVNSVWFYDDGTESTLSTPPIPINVHSSLLKRTDLGSPVAIANDFLDSSPILPRGPAEIFVKVDNDLILCPGWLECGLAIMNQKHSGGISGVQHEIDLLGIEPYSKAGLDIDNPRTQNNSVVFTDHIGGIGFFRRRAFAGRTRPQPNGRYGFTEWQWANPDIVKAWINPPMPVFLLDHLPREPWITLSREYEAKGWQRRQWGEYEERSSKLWDWWCK